MYQPVTPLNRMKLLAAAAGFGALSIMGIVAAINDVGNHPGTVVPVAMKGADTTTMGTPPPTPEISFASPTVKAPHK